MFLQWAFASFHDACVTFAAGIVGNLAISLRDLNRIGIIASGKIERMPKTVQRLRGIFADKIVRRMAIIADRYTAMT